MALVLSVPCGARAHEVELSEERIAQLARFHGARAPITEVATAADVRAAFAALEAFSKAELDHAGRSHHLRPLGSARARWARSVAIALAHYRGWGRLLDQGARISALLGTRRAPDVGRALLDLSRSIQHARMAAVIEHLSHHWAPESRAIAARLACLAHHVWRRPSERQRRFLLGVLRRVLRDRDPQVVASIADCVVDTAIPGLRGLLEERLRDERPTDSRADGVLGRALQTVGRTYVIAVGGLRTWAHDDPFTDPGPKTPEALTAWLRADERVPGFGPEDPGWELVLDAIQALRLGKTVEVETRMGEKATLALRAMHVRLKHQFPKIRQDLRIRFAGDGEVDAAGDFSLGLLNGGSHSGSAGMGESAYEWRYRVLAVPGKTDNEGVFRICLWRR